MLWIRGTVPLNKYDFTFKLLCGGELNQIRPGTIHYGGYLRFSGSFGISIGEWKGSTAVVTTFTIFEPDNYRGNVKISIYRGGGSSKRETTNPVEVQNNHEYEAWDLFSKISEPIKCEMMLRQLAIVGHFGFALKFGK
ncbi:hypothetical protein NECAME_11295 [Necator americanus]|uniref:Uncharacterized protein n=1 Tax=Necator americanus TaxID=51031 RepID=W2T620_NECAM|nr:hypothetical protein NECAME_11295 [Necator americanus]ETN77069.1 hypothetical protein NECAME_11295 [Necator americanus]